MKELAFVQITDGRMNLWAVTPSGDDAADNARGRGFADSFVDYIILTKNPTALFQVMRSIKTYGPIEIGFCHRLSELLMSDGENWLS